MHTFSCAVQSVDVDGLELRFEADAGEYHLCRLYVGGEAVVTFDRNGLATGVEHIEPPTEDPAESAATSEVTQPQTEPTGGGA